MERICSRAATEQSSGEQPAGTGDGTRCGCAAYARQNVSDVAVGSCAPAVCGAEEGRKQRAVVLGGIGQIYIFGAVGRPYGLMFEDMPTGCIHIRVLEGSFEGFLQDSLFR